MTESMSRRARQQRRPLRSAPGQVVALVVVVAIVVGVALVGAAVPPPSPAPAPTTADGVPVAPVGSYSSSAFCTGGAVGPDGLAGTTDFLTNTSPVAVQGTMTSEVAPGTGSGASGSGTPAPPTQRAVVVPARGQAAVDPAAGLPAGALATWFAFDGGGVAVNQVTAGPDGWSTAPCASRLSGSWSFAGGSTAGGDALTLDLANPTPTDAVVDVSFLTSSGVIVPSDYQGLTVPAGQLVSENVGDFVQNQSEVATVVTAQSGVLVAGELQQWAGSRGGIGLWLGAPAPATVWHFAQNTNTGGSVTFHLANPGTTAVVATLSFGLPVAKVVPVQVSLPAQSVATFSASSSGRLPGQSAYAVDVRSTGPIVVARSVQAPSGASTPPMSGGGPGTTTVATHWLVPAPGVPGAPGAVGATVDSLGVADPGSAPARVVVTVAGSGAPVYAMTVAPGALVVLGSATVSGLRPFDVRSTRPVSVEEDSGPSGAPGVVASTGMSFTS